MLTEESTFKFPEHPQDAVVRFKILVEPGEGDSLLLSANLSPGDMAWGQEQVESIFRQARVVPLVGTYVLVGGASGTVVESAPEGVDKGDRRSLVFVLGPKLGSHWEFLVETLKAFPCAEDIDKVARGVVIEINRVSLERTQGLSEAPVVDTRTVMVEGVECVHCGFGVKSIFVQILSEVFGRKVDDSVTQVGDLRFAVEERDDQFVVLIGYLGHRNHFAKVLNAELALRLKAAIQDVAVEVMTQVLVTIESQRRMDERVKASVLATYDIDPAVVAAQVDELETEARAEMAEETEVEDPNYDGDNGFDEDHEDTPGDALEEPIGEAERQDIGVNI